MPVEPTGSIDTNAVTIRLARRAMERLKAAREQSLRDAKSPEERAELERRYREADGGTYTGIEIDTLCGG